MSTELLVSMSQDIGEIKGLLTAHVASFTKHEQEDQAALVRIEALEVKNSRASGRASVWMVLLTGIATMAGIAIDHLIGKFIK
jgi:hypothetical protein